VDADIGFITRYRRIKVRKSETSDLRGFSEKDMRQCMIPERTRFQQEWTRSGSDFRHF
jgi:hypothetical protein